MALPIEMSLSKDSCVSSPGLSRREASATAGALANDVSGFEAADLGWIESAVEATDASLPAQPIGPFELAKVIIKLGGAGLAGVAQIGLSSDGIEA